MACAGASTTSLLTTQKSSCRSRFLRVPMAMQYRRPKHLPGHMFHDYYHRLLAAPTPRQGSGSDAGIPANDKTTVKSEKGYPSGRVYRVMGLFVREGFLKRYRARKGKIGSHPNCLLFQSVDHKLLLHGEVNSAAYGGRIAKCLWTV